jgi:hypothetical protein
MGLQRLMRQPGRIMQDTMPSLISALVAWLIAAGLARR